MVAGVMGEVGLIGERAESGGSVGRMVTDEPGWRSV